MLVAMGYTTPVSRGCLHPAGFFADGNVENFKRSRQTEISMAISVCMGDCGMLANGRLVMRALIGTSKMALQVLRGADLVQLRRLVMNLGQCMEHNILSLIHI
eukprot:2512559-Prorocentrum_lima.AAC.1